LGFVWAGGLRGVSLLLERHGMAVVSVWGRVL
jgi:hypothetical protein